MKVREVIQSLERHGQRNRELAPGTLNAILKQAGFEMSMRRYPLIIEPTSAGFFAFSPDVPGCVPPLETPRMTLAETFRKL